MIQYRFNDKATQALAYKELLNQGANKDDVIMVNTRSFFDIVVLDAKVQPSKNEFSSFIVVSKQ